MVLDEIQHYNAHNIKVIWRITLFPHIWFIDVVLQARHLLIPWSGGAFAPLGPFLCPTTEEKKWPIAPKPGP